MTDKKLNVLQFITPVGFYGAERWILALVNNSDTDRVRHDLVVTEESENQDLGIVDHFPEGEGKTFRVPMKSRFDPAVISKLSNIVKSRNIDIIHTHGYKSDILGLIVAKRNSIACVSTPHGFGDPEGFKLKLFIRLALLSYRFMDRVIPLSQQLVDELLSKGVPKARIQMIRNAVDVSEVEQVLASKPGSAAADKPIMGYIGRFDDNKNVRDIINCFNAVWESSREAELILIGDGETREQLEQQAAALPSAQSIRFLGFRHDRLDWMRDFSLFILASKSEGIPRCLMESMAMGIPVVAYDIAGVDQLITNDETGLLAPFGDTDGLVASCNRIIQDKDCAKRLSHNGQQFIHEHFSGKRMAGEYLQTYQNILDIRHG